MQQITQQAITLWAPGLLSKLRRDEAKESLAKLRLPSLEALLAKADKFAVKPQNFYQQASYLFHQPQTLPIAATQASIEVEQFNKANFWLSVDPVQMVPDRDTLVLMPNTALQIDEEESKALMTSFNEHFQQDQVQLEWGANNRWYLAMKLPVDIKTTVLAEMAYQSINSHMPQGNAAQYWRQMMNEAQMLMFTHPVNEQRREQGLPEINSIWVWGEGQLVDSLIYQREDAVIWSEMPYLQGMAKLCNAANQPSVYSYNDWQNFAQEALHQNQSKHLVHLDKVTENLDNLTVDQWLELLQQLENEWFTPILESLKQGQVSSLLLDLGMDYRSHIKPGDLRRFWRFKKPLHKL